jgi:hypothetical protein
MRSLKDVFGRKKNEVPPNYRPCSNCGTLHPQEELSHIELYMGTKVDMWICVECLENPPTTWKINYV